MPIYVIAAAAALACSLIALVWLLFGSREVEASSSAQSNLGRGTTLGDSRQIALSASARVRLLQPVMDAAAGWARGFTSAGMSRRVLRKLELAGLQETGWTVERVVVVRVAALVGGALLAIALVAGSTGRQALGMAALVVVVSYLGPEAWLDRKAGERQKLIEKQLPDVIDQLTVSVEAGLGFDAAMARSAEGRTGPLADELTRVLQDLQVGVNRDVALDRLVERTEVADLRAFVVAVRQSTRHGLPIARVLRIQSEELREKRRSRVEEQAGQLPVKIVFPLVFCILPSLFVVILGPAGLSIIDSF